MSDSTDHTPADAGGDQSAAGGEPPVPEIRRARSWRWSWVWLVPLLALGVAISLVVSVWVRTGPIVTISFATAAGLEVGQTKLRYREVVVGQVKDIRVAPDRQRVLVDVQLERDGSEYITQAESKFWIVQPQVSLSGVSGLDTLISGVYLSVDTPEGPPKGRPVHEFTGLDNPPEILSGQHGRRFELTAENLGSLAVGSRIYYRRIEVGRVVSYAMAPDGRSVQVQIFIHRPYDHFVTSDTRFWNASGIDISVSTEGVKLRTDGLKSVLNGGIAFAQADESTAFDGQPDHSPAPAGSHYTLFATRDLALADPDGIPFPVEMHFDQSVRGLRIGASVDFHGQEVGKIVDIDLEFDATRKRFYTRVRGLIYPARFGQAHQALVASEGGRQGSELLALLVQHGLRAQLRTASLLTGQQYVALDFFTNEKVPQRITGAEQGRPMEEAQAAPHPSQTSPGAQVSGQTQPESQGFLLPTVPGDFDRLQRQIGSIITRLDAVPIDQIGRELRDSLQSMQGLLQRLNKQLAPQASRALESARTSLDRVGQALSTDAPIMGDLREALSELQRASRALRLLADSLQAHPEALLRGYAPDRLK